MDKIIRVVVVDDHPLFRHGVVQTLQSASDIKVVGDGASIGEAMGLAADFLPDVMILDVGLPENSVGQIGALVKAHPAMNVLMLTVVDSRDVVSAAIAAGAKGYLLKGASRSELIDTVRMVSHGAYCLGPDVAFSVMANGGEKAPAARMASTTDNATHLTPREDQILGLLRNGRSNKQIARELSLSEKTVKFYLTNLLRKLKVHSRLEAALLSNQQLTGAGSSNGPVYTAK